MSQEYEKYRELFNKSRYTEAAHFAGSEYLEGDRNNSFWLTRQAAALSRAGQYEKALAIAKQALALQPSNSYTVLAVADALFGMKKINEALQYYEEIAENPKLSNVGRKGVLECLSVKKEWDKILELASRWEMPEDQSFRWKVKALVGLKRRDEAIQLCARWLEKLPDNRGALWELTELEIQRDGLDAVLAKMSKLAKISSLPSVYKEIYASLCKRAEKPELALKQYEKLSKIEANPKFHRQQAFAMTKAGKYLEAIPILEELLRLDPKDFYVHTSYIAACKRTQQFDRAVEFYEKLIEMHPEETKLHGRLKTVNKMTGAEK